MVVAEDAQYSRDYLDPQKRSIPNSVQVFFRDGTATEKVTVEYPLGHRRRRTEGIPILHQKAEHAFRSHYGEARAGELMALFSDRARLESMPVHTFCSAFARVS